MRTVRPNVVASKQLTKATVVGRAAAVSVVVSPCPVQFVVAPGRSTGMKCERRRLPFRLRSRDANISGQTTGVDPSWS
jgi:hypothetical protein